MSTLTKENLDRYATSMTAIKSRGSIVNQLDLGNRDLQQYAALLLRLNIEDIVLSGLLTNANALDRAIHSFQGSSAKPVDKVLMGINPDYWPRPVKDNAPIKPGRRSIVNVDDPYLEQKKWVDEWAFLSGLLHARNPATKPKAVKPVEERLRDIHERTVTLLNHHWRTLAGSGDQLACVMHGSVDGRVHVSHMKPIAGPAARP